MIIDLRWGTRNRPNASANIPPPVKKCEVGEYIIEARITSQHPIPNVQFSHGAKYSEISTGCPSNYATIINASSCWYLRCYILLENGIIPTITILVENCSFLRNREVAYGSV